MNNATALSVPLLITAVSISHLFFCKYTIKKKTKDIISIVSLYACFLHVVLHKTINIKPAQASLSLASISHTTYSPSQIVHDLDLFSFGQTDEIYQDRSNSKRKYHPNNSEHDSVYAQKRIAPHKGCHNNSYDNGRNVCLTDIS